MINALIEVPEIMTIGEIANQYASESIFSDYRERTAANTLRRQRADLALFTEYLSQAGMQLTVDKLLAHPTAWAGITHGLVDGFVRWQLSLGYAIGSVNVRLSTVKKYCELATRAGAMEVSTLAMVKLVEGYSHKAGRNVDEKRETTRIGAKKAEAISISAEQARLLKQQPDTPQGRRDAFLMCLLLDHGLRCSEIADLTVDDIDMSTGTFSFYREKVDKQQRHELTRDSLIAATRYFAVASPEESLMMGSRKGGKLEGRMSERAITARMNHLCQAIDVEGASAHDGRHAWATIAIAAGTDIASLQEAGGWNSPAMPLRYVNAAKIANQGVKLG
jgi:integrase